MKNLISVLIMLIMVYGCSNSTTPDEKPMVTIEILQNGLIQETFIVTEEENGDVYPIYFEEQQITHKLATLVVAHICCAK